MPDYGYLGIAMVIISLCGIFGNLNIVVATIRRKKLRSNSGMLLCFLATVDLACLIFDVVNGVWILAGITLERPDCFNAAIVYCCAQFISNSVVLGIALDRLFAVTFPTRYMRLSLLFTMIVAALPGLLLGGVFVVLGTVYAANDNRKLSICLVGGALPSFLSNLRNSTLMTLNASVVIIYLAAYIVLYIQKRRARKNNQFQTTLKSHEKAMRSVTAFLIVFVGTYFISRAGISFPQDEGNAALDVFKRIMMLLVVVAYSQCYFVYFWRNSDYREAFKEQLGFSKFKNIKVATSPVTVTVLRTMP